MTYNKNINYCSIPDKLRRFVGMKKNSDVCFGIRIGYHCYLHDRQYRNEVSRRQTRKVADNLLRQRILNQFKSNKKLLLGLYVSNVFYIGLRVGAEKYWC